MNPWPSPVKLTITGTNGEGLTASGSVLRSGRDLFVFSIKESTFFWGGNVGHKIDKDHKGEERFPGKAFTVCIGQYKQIPSFD